MSELLQVKQSYYSEVENGKREVTGKIVKKLNEERLVSSDWFYSGNGAMFITLQEKLNSKSMDMLRPKIDEIKEIEERLKITRSPKNEIEEGIFRHMEQMQNFSKNRDNVLKELNKVKRKAVRQLRNENSSLTEILDSTVNFCQLVDTLADVSNNYFDIFSYDDLPSDLMMEYSKIPTDKEIKSDLTIQLQPLVKFESSLNALSKSISEFLHSVKEIDKYDII